MAGWYKGTAGSQCSACVKQPKSILGVNYNALHTDEIVLVVCSRYSTKNTHTVSLYRVQWHFQGWMAKTDSEDLLYN